MSEYHVGKTRIRLIRDDITNADVDAIVNAANPSLMGGGGVDGAIHRKGGSRILEECKSIRAKEWPQGLPTGKAVITSGGDLKARYVIHTVGPVWQGGSRGEPRLLAEAYTKPLELAVSKNLKTIAFASISTGAYGYPVEDASLIALTAAKRFLEKQNKLTEVIFVLFTQDDFQIYVETATRILKKGKCTPKADSAFSA